MDDTNGIFLQNKPVENNENSTDMMFIRKCPCDNIAIICDDCNGRSNCNKI